LSKIQYYDQSYYLEQLTERIGDQRNFIQVVTELRQVGKTTMVLQLLKNSNLGNTYESADGILNSNAEWIVQVWETARLKMKLTLATDYQT